ncbi:MAG: hypothetical protein LBV27_04635 [Oscillospiraceae bacterium]|nr:hypothetical protein [Oscillospiraceae bacterium]
MIIRANRSYCKMCGKVSTEPCVSAGKGDRQICQTCLDIALKNRDAVMEEKQQKDKQG